MAYKELNNEELYNLFRSTKSKIAVIDLLICDIEDDIIKLILRGKEDTRIYCRKSETKKSLIAIASDYKYYAYLLEEELCDRDFTLD